MIGPHQFPSAGREEEAGLGVVLLEMASSVLRA